MEHSLSKKNFFSNKRGFIVLIAVMVTTIILTVGIGVLNLALREFMLANVGRDSSKAFYATDTGIDCIFSYDISATNPTQPNFASPLRGVTNPDGNDSIVCNGQNMRTGPQYVTSGGTCLLEAGPPATYGDCSITKLSRNSNPTEVNTAKRALCLDAGAIDADGRCVGACVTLEVRKIKTGDETQRTELVANGISDCQGPRPVERSLILTWE